MGKGLTFDFLMVCFTVFRINVGWRFAYRDLRVCKRTAATPDCHFRDAINQRRMAWLRHLSDLVSFGTRWLATR